MCKLADGRNVDLHKWHLQGIHMGKPKLCVSRTDYMKQTLNGKLKKSLIFDALKMPRLSENQRNQSIGMLAVGYLPLQSRVSLVPVEKLLKYFQPVSDKLGM